MTCAILFVSVPPKIVPFYYQEENIIEGHLARVSCIVSRGDLPLQLHWEKDGVEISSGINSVEIKSFDEHSSILSISSVSTNNNGLYTCVANNAVGMARHSAQLIVKGNWDCYYVACSIVFLWESTPIL